MALYRQLQLSFWRDAFVMDLTPEEKFFYVYLFQCSNTKQCGIFELPKRAIEYETGYNRETIDKLLERFINRVLGFRWSFSLHLKVINRILSIGTFDT